MFKDDDAIMVFTQFQKNKDFWIKTRRYTGAQN